MGAHSIVFGKTPSETALVTLAKGNDIEPTKEYYTALRTTNTITLDGNFPEWTGAPVLADPRFAVPKFSGTNDSPNYVLFELYDAGGPGTAVWTGPDDQTSAVQVVYDADNVYFGFVVTDEYHENAASSAWNGDSVQLMIANADRNAQVALYNYALGGVEGATLAVIVQHEAGPGGTDAVVTRDGVNKKTRYEIKLPASALGLTPPLTVGMQFGLGMAINDGDLDAPGQQGWGGLGAHSIVFGKTPSETALVTLGTTVSGSDRLFLSAINPTIEGFSFRANDKGPSIVAPASARLTIDSLLVTLTASPKVGDATDFTYRPVPPFLPGNHTYSIEIRDTLGNIVRDSGNFLTPTITTLSAALRAVSVDTSKRGFIWRVFENQIDPPLSLEKAELALIGQLVDEFNFPYDNLANPGAVGAAVGPGTYEAPNSTALVRFEIPGVINLSQTGGEANGNFTPDEQMPGIPGTFSGSDGIDAEIVTFVEFPVGVYTMGMTSDDGFKTQAGFIGNPATGLLLGQSEVATPTNGTTFMFVVRTAGIYPLRTVYQDSIEAAHIEWFTVKADGTKVLLNDTANGGLRAYRVGVAPSPFPLAIAIVAGQRRVTWTEPGVVLQESTNLTTWIDLPAATSPYNSIPAARKAVFYRLKK